MRHPRRRALRPSSVLALTLILGLVTLVVSALVLALGELGRFRAGRVILVALSGSVLLFFAIGWATAPN